MNRIGYISIILILLLIPPLKYVETSSSDKKDIGIYAGPGAYQLGVTYLTQFAQSRGFTYKLLYEDDILNDELENVKLLIIPGGWAGEVDQWGRKGYGSMSSEAIDKIREFVKDGGSYYGICAGAYFASVNVIWEGGLFHNELALFNGTSIGPIEEIAPWPGTNWTNVLIESSLGINKTTVKAFYWGGSYFESDVINFTTLEKYEINNKPATILFNYGKGKVILTGLHHEWVNYQHPDWQKENWDVLEKILNTLIKEEEKDTYQDYLIPIGIILIIIMISAILLFRLRTR